MARVATPDLERPIEPPGFAELVATIAAGRAGHGRSGEAWARMRALVLGYAAQGWLRSRIGGMLGLSTQRITQLRTEGCAALLHGGLPSADGDVACGELWLRWCRRGDTAACARVSTPLHELGAHIPRRTEDGSSVMPPAADPDSR